MRREVTQNFGESGAGSRIRTRDPEITNHVLYQLSYTGAGEGFYQKPVGCLEGAIHFLIFTANLFLSRRYCMRKADALVENILAFSSLPTRLPLLTHKSGRIP